MDAAPDAVFISVTFQLPPWILIFSEWNSSQLETWIVTHTATELRRLRSVGCCLCHWILEYLKFESKSLDSRSVSQVISSSPTTSFSPSPRWVNDTTEGCMRQITVEELSSTVTRVIYLYGPTDVCHTPYLIPTYCKCAQSARAISRKSLIDYSYSPGNRSTNFPQ